jgi:hypothetical protein
MRKQYEDTEVIIRRSIRFFYGEYDKYKNEDDEGISKSRVLSDLSFM